MCTYSPIYLFTVLLLYTLIHIEFGCTDLVVTIFCLPFASSTVFNFKLRFDGRTNHGDVAHKQPSCILYYYVQFISFFVSWPSKAWKSILRKRLGDKRGFLLSSSRLLMRISNEMWKTRCKQGSCWIFEFLWGIGNIIYNGMRWQLPREYIYYSLCEYLT